MMGSDIIATEHWATSSWHWSRALRPVQHTQSHVPEGAAADKHKHTRWTLTHISQHHHHLYQHQPPLPPLPLLFRLDVEDGDVQGNVP